ncbi:MAG: phage holin family protein [Actinomycetota bacterium]
MRTPVGRGGVPLHHFLLEFAVSAVSFWLVAAVLPGITIDEPLDALFAAALVAVLNAALWPIIARLASRAILWTAGLLGLVLNGAILLLAEWLIDGVQIESLLTAALASLAITIVSIAVGSALSIDDDDVWRRQTMRRMVQRLDPPTPTDVPGVLFLQIDGLGEGVLRQAIADGHAPNLARWVRSGTHRIVGWECDLSSQTGAMQAGILHGNNENMPAFRWYDKESGKVLTSNRPRDAAEIERRQSDGHGLLADGGASHSNVFSGDSTDSILTFSTLLDRERQSDHTANYILSDPYAVGRLIALSLADIARELRDARRARRRGVEPSMHRGGVYPLLRAATTTILRDLTLYTLISDMYRGVPVAYADFVGYDEVAHHSGIAAPTALDTLQRLDTQIARLEKVLDDAPRPYHIVVLSDHGQTQGATFRQRYGHTLEEFVTTLVEPGTELEVPELASEGWGNLNGALSEAARDEDSRVGAAIRLATRRRTVDGDVVLGPSYATSRAEADERAADTDDTLTESDIVVLASGNLGLISFTDIDGRATMETIGQRHPGLLQGLAEHPGVGFVMVRSEAVGAIVVGGHGIRVLDDDRVEGDDPLATFGPHTADHLRRTDSFVNCPDILVNSFYDPHADEGAAFEELIGFHGGLGGAQGEPFVLYPSTFAAPTSDLVGAASIHHLFKQWLADVPGSPPPFSTAESTEPSGVASIAAITGNGSS